MASSTYGTLLMTELLHLLIWTVSKMDWKDCGIPKRWVCYGHVAKDPWGRASPLSGEASSVSYQWVLLVQLGLVGSVRLGLELRLALGLGLV